MENSRNASIIEKIEEAWDNCAIIAIARMMSTAIDHILKKSTVKPALYQPSEVNINHQTHRINQHWTGINLHPDGIDLQGEGINLSKMKSTFRARYQPLQDEINQQGEGINLHPDEINLQDKGINLSKMKSTLKARNQPLPG
ncbi:hypothetical protein [Virgibacillus siamensis]|uniref:hypothetical protein n=1 Tax=Virgibacillus siamensis TaxID=480071 RepID=UPI0009847326|nr:hypothetical protein [Virgibacillus siamensis]